MHFNSDKIDLWRARVDAPELPVRTGILDFEYEGPQSVSVAVDLCFPASMIISPASIDDVVNYDRIAQAVRGLQDAAHTPLLESIAIGLVNLCFTDERIAGVRVSLTKNVIYPFAKPTVELRLSREEWFFRFSTARPAHVGLVVAHDKDRIIGDAFNNSIPWSVPSDTAQWLRLSEERVVIAGRKTAEEVLASGKMPGRRMVVISRQACPSLPNTPAGYLITVPSLGYALSLLPDERVMIIGGGQLFDEAIAKDVVDTLWVSEIAAGVRDRVTTPVYFPRIPHWMYTKTEQFRPGSVIDEFDYLTCVYQRDQSRPKVRHERTNC